MNENRRQILNMLAANKITAEEAERLLTALESNGRTVEGAAEGSSGSFAPGNGSGNGGKSEPSKSHAKYLRVLVEAREGIDGRAGMRGSALAGLKCEARRLGLVWTDADAVVHTHEQTHSLPRFRIHLKNSR